MQATDKLEKKNNHGRLEFEIRKWNTRRTVLNGGG